MYGRFTTTQLQKYAKEQGARLRREQQQRREEQEQDDDFRTYDHSWLGPVKSKSILYGKNCRLVYRYSVFYNKTQSNCYLLLLVPLNKWILITSAFYLSKVELPIIEEHQSGGWGAVSLWQVY